MLCPVGKAEMVARNRRTKLTDEPVVITRQEAKAAILAYMAQWGGRYADWYCGIASDPRDRLFNAHCVKEQGGAWIIRECANDACAREVEAYFVNTLSTAGGPGGGDGATRYVYAYKMSPTTRE